MDSKTSASDLSPFFIPRRLRLKDLRRSLDEGLVVKSEPPIPLQRTFLDTFDWRFYAAGIAVAGKRFLHRMAFAKIGVGVTETGADTSKHRYTDRLPAAL